MEAVQSKKKIKTGTKKPSCAALRVRRETKRQIVTQLETINKKDFGRRIRIEEYLSLAFSLVTPKHLEELREASLTNADRLERDFRAYVAQHGPISQDEYLGKRLNGEIATPPKNQKPTHNLDREVLCS